MAYPELARIKKNPAPSRPGAPLKMVHNPAAKLSSTWPTEKIGVRILPAVIERYRHKVIVMVTGPGLDRPRPEPILHLQTVGT
jgi:hypothetical protein